MAKILVATEKPFAPLAIEKIREITEKAGFELILLEKYADKSDLIRAVAGVEALIVRSDKVDSEVLEAGANLKIVVRAGAGYDNVDLETATEKGIVVMNTPGQNSNAVAELATGMMVYSARNMFNGSSGTELYGKKLGIHGYGNVGKHVTRIAKGFGMEVFTFHPRKDDEEIKKEGLTPLGSIEELYKTCNYISLNIPAREENLRLVGYKLLSSMPKGGTLVNTARKEVIDEEGLLKAMEERADLRYLSDIEPACKDDMAVKYAGRYFFTPRKMGAQTAEANINAGIAAANQIVGFIKKGDTTFQVNK